MISYTFEHSHLDSPIKWPNNVIYGNRKYYLMNKEKDLVDNKNKFLFYYCVKFHYQSKVIKNTKICD